MTLLATYEVFDAQAEGTFYTRCDREVTMVYRKDENSHWQPLLADTGAFAAWEMDLLEDPDKISGAFS